MQYDRGRRPRVLHFCETVLPRSETFVQQRLQGDRFDSVVAGWRRIEGGLALPCPSLILPDREWSTARSLPARALRRLLRPVKTAHQAFDIGSLLLRAAPTVVHAHFGSTGVAVAPACARLGVPLVTSFYGFDVGQLPGKGGGARMYDGLFATAAALTAEGPALARALVRLGAPPEKIKLLPLAVPAPLLADPPARRPGGVGPFNLLQIARFVPKKGIDITLRAMAFVRAKGLDARLVLVGDGPLRAELESLIDQLQLRPVVDLPGFVDHRDLEPLFSSADAYVQPSRTAPDGDSEGGHPAVLLEAQARALAVLATRHGDIPMVVRDGITGLLCAENDHVALAGNIQRLAREPQTVASMGLAARKMALRRHHPSTVRSLQERVYREAIRRFHMTRPSMSLLPRSLRLPDPFANQIHE